MFSHLLKRTSSSPLAAWTEPTKKVKERWVLALTSWAGMSLVSCPWTSGPWVLGLWTLGLKSTSLHPHPSLVLRPPASDGRNTVGSFDSQVFGLRLNNTTSFPGCTACRQLIVGLLSLHNHISRFLSYIYLLLILFPWKNLIHMICKISSPVSYTWSKLHCDSRVPGTFAFMGSSFLYKNDNIYILWLHWFKD